MSDFLVRHADATQIALFAIVLSVLWSIEQVVLVDAKGGRLRHGAINGLFALTALPAELLLSATCLGVSSLAAAHQWGLVALFPAPQNPWVKYGFVFVALDLCDYIYHRAMHHIPGLWRFHLVHHTDPSVDSSTTVREHPGESIVRGLFLVVWTGLLGASFEVLLLRQAAETVSAIIAHSAVRMPARSARVAGWIFITPNLHHVHHHFALPYTDRNFGGVFSVWDRLFGTYAELPEDRTVFGLDTHPVPRGLAFPTLLALPFAERSGGHGATAAAPLDPISDVR